MLNKNRSLKILVEIFNLEGLLLNANFSIKISNQEEHKEHHVYATAVMQSLNFFFNISV